MICTYCGHDNPAENYFCGMCGTPLEHPPAAVSKEPAAVTREPVSVADRLRALTADEPSKPGPKKSRPPTSQRPAAVPSFLGLDDEPRRQPPKSSNGISGPSFLGLDAPPDRNYLLEDDEPRSHWRGYLMALLILAVAVLAALQWRAEVKTQAYKIGAILWARMHATPTQPNVNEKSATGTPPPDNTASAPAQPPATANSAAAGDAAPAAAAPPSATPPPAGDSANTAAPTAAAVVDKPAANPSPDQPPLPARNKTADNASVANSRKPAAANDQQRADALLLTAQKYLHGLGVPRDCEQGLLYLKEAVRQPSAPARSQMGALFATGTCVAQNRVEAYHWFSSAMEVEPNNPWLGRERDTLYGEMTAAERQQLNR